MEDENDLYFDEEKQESIAAAYMPFVEQQRDIDQFSTLYSFKGPFELLQADIAGIRFLASLAVNPKYCLIFVDLFTSKRLKNKDATGEIYKSLTEDKPFFDKNQ